MNATRFVIGLFAAAATLSGAAACSHNTYEAAGEVAPANAVGLRVSNQNFLDMDVYAVSEGLSTRLGTVTGNSTKTFVLSPSYTSQDLQIVATPIGGAGRATTGPLVVGAGQTVDFRIGSVLRNSTVFIK
jgi:hypothetical protein